MKKERSTSIAFMEGVTWLGAERSNATKEGSNG